MLFTCRKGLTSTSLTAPDAGCNHKVKIDHSLNCLEIWFRKPLLGFSVRSHYRDLVCVSDIINSKQKPRPRCSGMRIQSLMQYCKAGTAVFEISAQAHLYCGIWKEKDPLTGSYWPSPSHLTRNGAYRSWESWEGYQSCESKFHAVKMS